MADMKKRLVVSFAFLVPLMYISMGSMAGLPLPAFLTGIENGVAFGMVQFCWRCHCLCEPKILSGGL